MGLVTEAQLQAQVTAIINDVNQLAGLMGSRVGLIQQRMKLLEERISSMERLNAGTSNRLPEAADATRDSEDVGSQASPD